MRQATVKAKVSGDVRQVTVREGETVQTGQVLARIDTADLDAKLIERIGALESAKAQLALAEKTRSTNQTLLKQNFISQNAFDNSESSYNVAQGSVKSAEAQVQIARNALRDAVAISPLTGIVAKRHVQPGEKVAFDSPLVTIVDLKDMELQARCPQPTSPSSRSARPSSSSSTASATAGSPAASSASIPPTEPGTRSFLVYVGIPNTDGARAADVRHRPHRARRQRRAAHAAVHCGARRSGPAIVWMLEDGKLCQAQRRDRARDDAAGRARSGRRFLPERRYWARASTT